MSHRGPYMLRSRDNDQLNVDIAKALSLCDDQEVETTEHLLREEEQIQLALALSQAEDDSRSSEDTEDFDDSLISELMEEEMNIAVVESMLMREEEENETNEEVYSAVNNTGSLPEVYKDYRLMPTQFSEDHMWTLSDILRQQRELRLFRGTEEVRECAEDQNRCLVCLSNVATRVAVPCGHRLCCRLCVSELADKSFFYSVTSADGQVLQTDRRVPVQCFSCRAIVGQIITVL